MADRKLTPERAAELKRKGWTHKQIAEEYDLAIVSVQHILARGGYVRPQLSHKKALPWKVSKAHQQKKEARYLRFLSSLSQGKKLYAADHEHRYAADTAISWANKILDDNKDIDYNTDRGFYLKNANPEDWHLKKLMQRVINAQVRKL